MYTLPDLFPLPNTTLSASMAANTLRTTMDSGTVRQRRRFSQELVNVDVTWSLSDVEFGVFAAFHKHRLNLGTDWFKMLLPLGGGIHEHVVRFVDGKFDQQYEEVGYWQVTASLEVQERVVFSSQVLEFYLGIGFSENAINELLQAIDNFHACVHETLPVNLS